MVQQFAHEKQTLTCMQCGLCPSPKYYEPYCFIYSADVGDHDQPLELANLGGTTFHHNISMLSTFKLEKIASGYIFAFNITLQQSTVISWY